MKRILLAGALVVGLCSTAWAQNAVVNFKTTDTSSGSKPVTDTRGLPVNIVGGGGSGGTSALDASAFTTGTTAITPMGGLFNDSATLSSGQVGAPRLTTKRAQIVDTDTSGNALYSAVTAPVPCKATATWNAQTGQTGTQPTGCDGSNALWMDWGALNGVGLGSPSNFGTTPGAVSVQGVNASLFMGTAVISATNGIYSNLLQGNAVISATNGLYTNLMVGNAAVATGTGAQGATVPRITVATDQATNAGAALVKGGVGVVNGGNTFQAVAASQTATVLQSSTGAIGDYLSHCDIYPTSTSPGVVTVFDNTNTAANSVILFPGGTSSVSSLVPFPIPVGALSVSGAWKVTTGANVSVVCYGKFS